MQGNEVLDTILKTHTKRKEDRVGIQLHGNFPPGNAVEEMGLRSLDKLVKT